MRKDKQLRKVDLHDGVIAESKLITLKQLDYARYLHKVAIAHLQERRNIAKGPSFDIRKKDIVTKHVSSRMADSEAMGSEQAQREAEFCYDDFQYYFSMFDQECKNQSKELIDLIEPVKGTEITEQDEENQNDLESLRTDMSAESLLHSDNAKNGGNRARARTH